MKTWNLCIYLVAGLVAAACSRSMDSSSIKERDYVSENDDPNDLNLLWDEYQFSESEDILEENEDNQIEAEYQTDVDDPELMTGPVQDPRRSRDSYQRSGYACGCTSEPCEAKRLHCGDINGVESRMRIVEATYGRKSKSLCNPQKLKFNTRCQGNKGKDTKKVGDMCNGKKDCLVNAENGIFGDPCPGTLKYLLVRYECKKIE